MVTGIVKICVGSRTEVFPNGSVKEIEVVFSTLWASTPPAATEVGKRPLKVCGFVEELIRVMNAAAIAAVSFFEVTTTVTLAGLAVEDVLVTGNVSVGTVAGAVNTPF